jgi:hypothetical protein
MSKKRWYLVPVAAALLALAVTGGAIFAQGNSGGHGRIGPQGIATRVAEILGLDEAAVLDALRQARQERQDAGLQSRLAQLVADKKLTQDESNAIRQWYQDRPVTNLPLGRFRHGSPEAVGQILDRMVAAGRFSREEADAVIEWYQGKPAVLAELSSGHPRYDRGSRGRGSRHGAHRGDRGAAGYEGVSGSFTPQIAAQSISY